MDDARLELVDGWLAKASSDRKAADRLEPGDDEEDYDPVLYGGAAFHLQQASEKTLKAYLTSRSIPFGKTHDLERLIGLAATVDPEFRSLSDDAETLAPFAVEVRYPGDMDELTRTEYDRVTSAAEAIDAFVMTRIVEDDSSA